ncbi:MAG: ABC transporter permease, partial [Lachnospiraceae bacterium]|nr:ABC transporter permease [Lachnospiraceae bacterium]
MFFRMIKKDLKEGKGLNLIILLFMVMVSALVAASVLLMFANIRGVAVSKARCNPYDAIIRYQQLFADKEKQQSIVEEIIRESYPDAKIEHFEGIFIDYTNIDYKCKDLTRLSQSYGASSHFLMKQPRNMNLVYDQNNAPFYVENGKIAIPYAFAMEYGVKVGDDFNITASNGKQYHFEISHITRDPIHDFYQRFIISDADYDFMSAECPQKMGFTGLQVDGEFGGTEQSLLNAKLAKDEEFGKYFYNCLLDGHSYSNSALISLLVTLFLTITCIFMILIIFFTIGFTIRSVLKKDEQELGIMKALGTDSASFRLLVAAKYVAFAVVGGAIGTVIGVIAGEKLIGRFYYNISYSLSGVDYVVAVLGTVCAVAVVIWFILLSMRRINKISVMDILSGEARNERIGHSDHFQLHNRKKMGLPLFLALSDILGNFK